jgi:hypothetical protein
MVGNQQREVFWRVPGCVENPDLDVAEIQRFSIPHLPERILCFGAFVQHILRTGNSGEPPASAYVIRM